MQGTDLLTSVFGHTQILNLTLQKSSHLLSEALTPFKLNLHPSFLQVKDILTVFLDTFKDQVLARPYFYKSSRLVSKALIKIRPPPYTRGGGDLMDQQVELDRRMLDWIVGLDTEMNELVEGSHLYHPKVLKP